MPDGWGGANGYPGGNGWNTIDPYNSGVTTGASARHTHTVTGGGDHETRPTNVYVNFIIKY